MFSLRAQPLWFRIVKWIVILALGWWLWNARWFWPVFGGAAAFGICMHLVYRWKTGAWTRPWGGWDDVETANGRL